MTMTPIPIETRHRKHLSSMRSWLDGRQYYMAADALEVVRKEFQGVRKDKRTPQLHHPLSVARLLGTLLPSLLHPEETLVSSFLHDLPEDKGKEWTRERVEARYNKRVGDAVWKLTKKSNGLIKSPELYYGEMATDPIASVVKLADRCHNLATMEGVHSYEKQGAYAGEVEENFLPMLRTARREFPQQYAAYANLEILLSVEVRLIGQILALAPRP